MSLKAGDVSHLDFAKGDGLLPAIVQDHQSGAVLMLGYMNEQALLQTLENEKVTFYSRSKGRLWTKGETSGHFLWLKSVEVDCDRDTLLILASPVGPTCHKGTRTCFGDNFHALSFLGQLEAVIAERKNNPSEKSYTSHLFNRGLDKIAQKVGEEAVEVVIESKNDDREKFLGETADLLYHLLVLLAEKEVDVSDVLKVLEERHK